MLRYVGFIGTPAKCYLTITTNASNLMNVLCSELTVVISLPSCDTSSVVPQALLLIARWMEDTAHYDTQTVLRQYKVKKCYVLIHIIGRNYIPEINL